MQLHPMGLKMYKYVVITQVEYHIVQKALESEWAVPTIDKDYSARKISTKIRSQCKEKNRRI